MQIFINFLLKVVKFTDIFLNGSEEFSGIYENLKVEISSWSLVVIVLVVVVVNSTSHVKTRWM